MKTDLVVTITCPDRPGIVERLTEVAVAMSANWEESRMARLGGDFAGIVRISVSQEKAEALARALRALEDDETTVAVKIGRPASAEPAQGYALYELRLAGADHEGIVHEVARYLAGHGINVEKMQTEVARAPVSGSPHFKMEAEIKVPPNLSASDLKAALDHVADELGVDIEVFPAQQ
jgi:glycine cleavage system transcriptional repressor